MSQTGAFISKQRTKLKITQNALSKAMGFKNYQFISLIENGHSKLPAYCISNLSRALKVSNDKIIKALKKDYEEEIREAIK